MIPVGQIRNISVLDIRPDTYWRYLASRISGYGKVRISGQMFNKVFINSPKNRDKKLFILGSFQCFIAKIPVKSVKVFFPPKIVC